MMFDGQRDMKSEIGVLELSFGLVIERSWRLTNAA